MVGWVAPETGAPDRALAGTMLISAWDPAIPLTHEQAVVVMADNTESLTGVTAESMAADLESHHRQMKLSNTAEVLARKLLLVLSATRFSWRRFVPTAAAYCELMQVDTGATGTTGRSLSLLLSYGFPPLRS